MEGAKVQPELLLGKLITQGENGCSDHGYNSRVVRGAELQIHSEGRVTEFTDRLDEKAKSKRKELTRLLA